ncbi:MAG: alcohol dehydrogenase catalytic domain-containing protein [Candidatus Nitrohelix vancouverensis]|uniref:Alcohol dehydrogenase catalytic domain-containing protein n=1 Tax=Candidatus Nitrohelix vancouverensis TaxID=2705534 RepID=A0A7T0G4R2_9BACT|nr:MAG: alcohol dehydrogenase catalytic domain-containing protein [Candidatus Nitrohelix vancouverensis]
MPAFARLIHPGSIRIEDAPSLQPGPGEVIVKTELAGVCGTDLALYAGDYATPLPLVIGHEYVGSVGSVGEGVDKQWIGKRVAPEINNTCAALRLKTQCVACRKGMSGHCLTRTVTGIVNSDGAFAEQTRTASGNLHHVPDSLDSNIAVLAEPLAAALQTFETLSLAGDETVVVLGPGRLGILIVFAAHLKGLKVIAVSRSDHKRQRALKFGAAHACAPEHAVDQVMELTEDFGADIVVDATGQPGGLAQAQDLVRPRGVIAAKTTCGLPSDGLDLTRLIVNEIRIQGSRCGPFAPALKILESHQERLRSLITASYPLQKINEALSAANREDKITIRI